MNFLHAHVPRCILATCTFTSLSVGSVLDLAFGYHSDDSIG